MNSKPQMYYTPCVTARSTADSLRIIDCVMSSSRITSRELRNKRKLPASWHNEPTSDMSEIYQLSLYCTVYYRLATLVIASLLAVFT